MHLLKRMSKRTLYKAIIGLMFLLVTACAIKYEPVESESVTVSNGHAVVRDEKFILITENRHWVKEPQNLSNYFTTFFVSIQNRTSDNLMISLDEFTLLDEEGNQYDAVAPDNVVKLLIPEEIMFDPVRELSHRQNYQIEQWRDARRNLMTDSFSFGTVLQGARKSGFIFFPRLSPRNQELKLIFRDYIIEFTR